MNVLVFDDLEPVQIPVTLGTGRYVLLEGDADVAAKYRSASARCAKFADGAVYGVDGVGDVEPYLVSLCLYEGEKLPLMPNGRPDKSRLVPLDTIRSWKASIVRRLFDKAKELTDLSETETEEKLLKQIEVLQKKLEKLKSEPSKNSHCATEKASV